MKRIFALTLCLLVLAMSCVCVSANAQDKTSTDYIYFQVPTQSEVAWNNFSIVFCHIWSEGEEGADFYPWQAKDERCEDLGNGYWRYDISKLSFEEDKTYSLIFSNENGMQTYNLSFTSDCKGDIVVCEGDSCVNPVDSEKKCAVARWLTNGEKVHPSAQVGSDGTMLDPDGVFNSDVNLKWGNAEGVSVEMPKVEIPTQAQTQAPTEVVDSSDEPQANGNLTLYIIIGGAALVVIAVVVVIVLKKKK